MLLWQAYGDQKARDTRHHMASTESVYTLSSAEKVMDFGRTKHGISFGLFMAKTKTDRQTVVERLSVPHLKR
jgi:hypothetical protein